MPVRSAVRRVVRPVVGPRVWRNLRRMDHRLRQAALRLRSAGSPQRAADLGLRAISGDLRKLATHFGTDKWGAHHRYAQHYQRHLARLRHAPINLLEIGIGGYSRSGEGGASLRMWKAYFPRAQVYGVDIQDKSHVDEPRITTFVADQSDPESLRAVADKIGRLDVIIDDGSHRSPHVITTFETLFPLLSDGGLYVVEDTQTSYWPEFLGAADPADPHTSMAMLKNLADGLNYEEFVDDDYRPSYTDRHVVAVHFYHNLVFIEKGVNAEGTRKRRILKDRYGPG